MSLLNFARESLELLALEAPVAHRAVRHHFTGIRARVEVDDESLCVEVVGRAVHVHRGQSPCDVKVRTSRAALERLLSSGLSLVDAVLRDELEFQGPLDRVLGVHDGLMAFLEGGVRSPSFPSLLQRFLSDTGPRGPVS